MRTNSGVINFGDKPLTDLDDLLSISGGVGFPKPGTSSPVRTASDPYSSSKCRGVIALPRLLLIF